VTPKHIAYWTTTAFVAFALISGGYGELNGQWRTLDTVTILGCPAYFLTIIGVWKVAAGIALLAPRFPLVKEWAYAGTVCNMTGAFVSHAAVGDYGAGAYHLTTTGLIALLAVASYVLRPGSRRLQASSGARRGDALVILAPFSLRSGRSRQLDLKRRPSQAV
jgi:uncharacterized membrane protein YphA (DoxX/SURF4 family)